MFRPISHAQAIRGAPDGDCGERQVKHRQRYAIDQAAGGIRIVAITVGWDANRELMQQLAEITDGREFQAAGDPQEYTEALQQIFFMLGTGDDVMLIE